MIGVFAISGRNIKNSYGVENQCFLFFQKLTANGLDNTV
jgi:hypothetical protein